MEILYVDKDIIAINKPPGLTIHSGGSVFGRTVADELLERFPEIAGVGEDAARPGIVHRLDRDTSGVMVVARTQESFAALKDHFQKRLVEKTYIAIVCGIPAKREGMINFSIGRLVGDPTKRGVNYRDPIPGITHRIRDRIPVRGARDAVTHYRVLKIGGSASQPMALMELRPKTGRMHQLRVHMKAIGHPVACDVKYGGKNVCCPLGIGATAAGAVPPRHLLHAQSLSFAYPEGRRLSFEADPPPDFALAVKALF